MSEDDEVLLHEPDATDEWVNYTLMKTDTLDGHERMGVDGDEHEVHDADGVDDDDWQGY